MTMKKTRKRFFLVLLGTIIVGETAVQARTSDFLLGGVVGAITGAAIVSSQQPKCNAGPRCGAAPRHHRKKHHRHKSTTITREMKIQESLVALGFYSGKIDGDLNSYETRAAFKKFNITYGIANDSSISPDVKDQLIYLYNLFILNKYLNAEGTTKRTKGRRLQAALKVFGAYHSKIDGIIGNGTRKAIAVYRMNQGMIPGTSLSADEKYELISSAIERNNNDIREAVASLKRKSGQSLPSDTNKDRQSYSEPQQLQPNANREEQYENKTTSRSFVGNGDDTIEKNHPSPADTKPLESLSADIDSGQEIETDKNSKIPTRIGAP
jgi:peptidoglycan hydrolase-like protein with peptidoglycan-binding domain